MNVYQLVLSEGYTPKQLDIHRHLICFSSKAWKPEWFAEMDWDKLNSQEVDTYVCYATYVCTHACVSVRTYTRTYIRTYVRTGGQTDG